MHTHAIVSLSMIFAVIHLSEQNLGKQPLLPGLGVDLSFLKAPASWPSPNGDRNLCNCPGGSLGNIYTVNYQGSIRHNVVLCMCNNAVDDANYMIQTMGRVPAPVRRYNKAMVSPRAGACGGAYSGGDVSVYCSSKMDISVFIHESAHSMDRGKSATSEWRDAVARDSCVPDPYANSSYAEDFAQVVVVWVHLVGTKRHQDFGGAQYACMRNQLQLMAKYLPASTVLP